MSTKDKYIYRILKAYSILVDFEGETGRLNVPGPVENETFGQWRRRVLGADVTNVNVFGPMNPAPQKKMSTLQAEASATNFERVIRDFSREKDTKKDLAVNEAVEVTETRFSTLPKDAINDILSELEHQLEPSLGEFFKRLLARTPGDIDVESLLRDLVNSYNNSVRIARESR
jgi:hypothetical protein